MARNKLNSLDFDILRNQLVAAGGQAVDIAIGDIASDLAGALGEYLGLASLRLQQFRMLEQGDAAIRIAGSIKVPVPHNPNRKVDLGIDARFTRARAGVGYTIILAVSPATAQALLGDIGKVLEALPVPMYGLWLSISSDALGSVRVDTPGQELAEAVVEAGRGYMFRLGGRLLKQLNLDKTVFYLADFPNSVRFATRTRIVISLGPFLDFTITSIAIDGPDAITFGGEGLFNFLGQKLAFNADIGLSTGGFSLKLEFGRFLPNMEGALFHPLTFTRAAATFDGTLSAYALGVEGDFVIAGSGNGGSFLVKYATGATNIIPDLFELVSNRLILSDLVTLASGFTVTLPAFLDRMIVLENSYIYFSKTAGVLTLAGTPSVPGIKAHSNVTLLGYKTYGEVSLLAGKVAANFQFAPIRLGSVIEISGSGQGSPRGFKGNQVGKNAVLLQLDGEQRSAAASLKVKLFGQAATDAIGTLSDKNINFRIRSKLPAFGQSELAVALEHEVATIETSVHMAVGINADWGFGRFRIANAAEVEADLAIVAKPDGADGKARVRASLGPIKLAFTLDFDPLDLDGLARQIREEVEKQIEAALKQAVIWLQAVLDKTIEYLGEAVDLAEAIGRELRETFNVTAKKAAAALREAGYELNKAYLVLEKGFRAGYNEFKDLLQDAGGYAEREVTEWIRKVADFDDPKFQARTVAELFLMNGYGINRAIAEAKALLKDMKDVAEVIGQLRDGAASVAKLLIDAGVGVKDAADYLARAFFDLSEDVLRETMKGAGYAVKDVTREVGRVFEQSGRIITNVRDEVRRSWNRYKPRITIRW